MSSLLEKWQAHKADYYVRHRVFRWIQRGVASCEATKLFDLHGSSKAWQPVRQVERHKDLYLSGVASCETSELFDLDLSIKALQAVRQVELMCVGKRYYALQAVSQVRTSEKG